ncbi:Hypothetical protein SRAE_X000183800 [Strongyloides ratti]|uniref:Uncharacterized protein n=1 Tax=Strongyloides ratti TaxID=34506 RepID=A0A090KXZ1_STRRB|nr:Hypothetical protein SRAE_X000183800 [Strongyloides ratti]CEF60098.1 Hypothetical protein SRAE_X000183800 [Strongyloides ratti]
MIAFKLYLSLKMILIYLLKFNILVIFFTFISYVYGCFPIIVPETTPKPPVCCQPLKLGLIKRVPPIKGSYSSGWDQCSILNSYNNEPCPNRGMFTCRMAPYSNAIGTNLQLIKDNITVVEENHHADISEIWVTCVDGEWKINGKTFTHFILLIFVIIKKTQFEIDFDLPNDVPTAHSIRFTKVSNEGNVNRNRNNNVKGMSFDPENAMKDLSDYEDSVQFKRHGGKFSRNRNSFKISDISGTNSRFNRMQGK